MAREPQKVNSACLRTNRVGITKQLHLDSRILRFDRERQGKYTVGERDENCTKSRDDLASVQTLPEFTQFLRGLSRRRLVHKFSRLPHRRHIQACEEFCLTIFTSEVLERHGL
jgi:hypothetical protein